MKKPRAAAQAALIAEMQAIVRMAAEPRQPVDGIKAAVGRASRSLGISYRRAMTFWYGHTEKVLVSNAEATRLRAESDRLLALKIERMERELAVLRVEMRLRDAKKDPRLAYPEVGGSAEAPLGDAA